MGAGGLHQRLRHRQHGRGARQGPGHAEVGARPAQGGVAATSWSAPATTSTSSTRRRSSSRAATPPATSSPVDPLDWGGVYTETNGWNFAFTAQQDGQGLANLYGGQKALRDKLDAFFATPENADRPGGYGGVIHEMLEARAVRMGQLGMSNQPSHHIPYMYNFAGAPAKTQATVREILRRLYVGSEIGQGYLGDEDNGEMSSWYILSSLGIYPLQAGSSEWAIGSPQFTKMTVHRSSGDIVVNAPNNSTDERLRAGREGQRQEAARPVPGRRPRSPRAAPSTSRWAPSRRPGAAAGTTRRRR